MKRRTWYCYRLEEKRSKCDKPYYGKTYDLARRAKQWKRVLKLDYIPELHIEYTDTSEQRVFDFEQEKRISNCWPRESSLRHQRNMRKKGSSLGGKIGGKIAGKINGKKCAESGHMAYIQSIGTKIQAKNKAVVTKEQAEQIKKEYNELERSTFRSLGKKYGISYTIIYKIVHEKFTNYKD